MCDAVINIFFCVHGSINVSVAHKFAHPAFALVLEGSWGGLMKCQRIQGGSRQGSTGMI